MDAILTKKDEFTSTMGGGALVGRGGRVVLLLLGASVGVPTGGLVVVVGRGVVAPSLKTGDGVSIISLPPTIIESGTGVGAVVLVIVGIVVVIVEVALVVEGDRVSTGRLVVVVFVERIIVGSNVWSTMGVGARVGILSVVLSVGARVVGQSTTSVSSL